MNSKRLISIEVIFSSFRGETRSAIISRIGFSPWQQIKLMSLSPSRPWRVSLVFGFFFRSRSSVGFAQPSSTLTSTFILPWNDFWRDFRVILTFLFHLRRGLIVFRWAADSRFSLLTKCNLISQSETSSTSSLDKKKVFISAQPNKFIFYGEFHMSIGVSKLRRALDSFVSESGEKRWLRQFWKPDWIGEFR